MANLNFDMLASPNFVRLVRDGDLSHTPDPGEAVFAPAARPGSAAIERVFNEYFDFRGLAHEPAAFDGRSDYGPFIAAGIPAGGLFSGAEGIKTEAQVALYGGAAGSWYDPCYHQACDTLNTILGQPPLDRPRHAGAGGRRPDAGRRAASLDQLADAAAHATWYLAMRANPLGAAERLAARARAVKRAAAGQRGGLVRVSRT